MKRGFAVVVVLGLGLALLGSCGQSKTDKSTVEETEKQQLDKQETQAQDKEEKGGNKEESKEKSKEKSKEEKEVVLNLFHQKQEAQETFAKIIEEFTKQYPNIKIKQEIVTNEPAAILKSRIATDEIPDIFQAGIEVIDISKGGYMVDLTSEPCLENISRAAIESPSFTDQEGKTWAMPIDGSCIGIFYNKDIFAKYGLEVPQTVTDFDKLLKTLKENGETAFALGFKDAWTIKPAIICAFSPAVYGKDISWDEARRENKTSFVDTPGWALSYQLLEKIYKNGNTQSAFDTDYNGACAMLANGEAVMMAQGLWALEPIRAIAPDINIGIMPLPISENPDEAKLHQFPDFSLSISSHSNHIAEAKLFLEFMATKEMAKLWTDTAKLFSAVNGASAEFDPVAQDVNQLIEQQRICSQADRGWPTAFHPEFEATLSSYLLGKTSLENVLQSLDKAWEMAQAAAK